MILPSYLIFCFLKTSIQFSFVHQKKYFKQKKSIICKNKILRVLLLLIILLLLLLLLLCHIFTSSQSQICLSVRFGFVHCFICTCWMHAPCTLRVRSVHAPCTLLERSVHAPKCSKKNVLKKYFKKEKIRENNF